MTICSLFSPLRVSQELFNIESDFLKSPRESRRATALIEPKDLASLETL